MAIRFLLGNRCKIGTLSGERIAAPVCGLVRNDREIGHWFLKLMTLPRGGWWIAEGETDEEQRLLLTWNAARRKAITFQIVPFYELHS